MIFRCEIPVENYEGDAVFFQPLYLHGEKSPTKADVLGVLNKLHERDSQYAQYTGTWEECINIVESVVDTDFPRLFSNLIQTSERVNHPKFGDQPLTLIRITPHEFGTPPPVNPLPEERTSPRI